MLTMPRWSRPGRTWAGAGLLVYAVILVAAPVLHHDSACHLWTPSHCSSCQVPDGLMATTNGPSQNVGASPECMFSPAPEPGTPHTGFRLPARSPPR